MTARQALKSLCSLGVAYSQRGKGTFVSEIKLEKHFRQVQSFTEEMEARGSRPHSKLISSELLSAEEATREALELEPEEKVIRIRRVRVADSWPMGIETTCLPQKLFPDLLERFDPRSSLYRTLARVYGIHIVQADEVVEAGLANAETARLLGIADGSPVFLFSAPLTSRADKRSNTSSPHFAVIATRLRTGWANSATTILPGVRHEHTGVCKRSISIAKSQFEQGVNHVGRKRGVFRSGCLLGASPLGCRPNQVGDPNSGAPHTFSSWFNAAAFTAPSATQTTETTERPGAIRGPGFPRTDLSLFKNIKFTERFNGQFRFETFNTFNHTNPICCGSTNFTSTLYNPITSTRDPRILQRGLKLNF